MIHVLNSRQTVRADLQTCWDFFSNPSNLAKITPPDLDFRVLSKIPEKIHEGMMIEYRVRPVLGIPLTWLTEITHVRAPHYFVDEQRSGPYAIWHHEHEFHELPDGGTELIDRVHYVLPLSPLSEILHPLIVAPQLRKIFDFRTEAVNKRFSTETFRAR